jgi:hypothetical protein
MSDGRDPEIVDQPPADVEKAGAPLDPERARKLAGIRQNLEFLARLAGKPIPDLPDDVLLADMARQRARATRHPSRGAMLYLEESACSTSEAVARPRNANAAAEISEQPTKQKRRPADSNKHEGAKLDNWHRLDKKIIPAMLELDATCEEKRRVAAEIAFHVQKSHECAQPIVERLPELRRRGLTESKRGKKGGHWLTAEGLRIARAMLGKCSPARRNPT